MTSQEYKEKASSNGYDLGAKTDLELLSDYAFHKAACKDGGYVVWVSGKDSHGGTSQGFAVPTTLARLKFNMALDGLDEGKEADFIWSEVCATHKTWDEVHVNGVLDLSKID